MKYTKAAALLFLTVATSMSLCAASVTLALVQKNPLQEEVPEISRIIENTIMDYYFDNGQIISNESISNDWKKFNSADFALTAAREGGSSYVIAVLAEYKNSQSQGTSVPLLTDIAEIQWKVVRTSDGRVLGSGKLIPDYKKQKSDNSITGIRDFARQVARETAALVRE